MKLRLRTGGKTFAVDEPASIEVLDSKGALVAVVMQPGKDAVQILTPGDPRFDTYALANRVIRSTDTVFHENDENSGKLLGQPVS